MLVLREAFGLALSEVGAVENSKQRRDSPGFRPPQVPCDYWSSRGTGEPLEDTGIKGRLQIFSKAGDVWIECAKGWQKEWLATE